MVLSVSPTFLYNFFFLRKRKGEKWKIITTNWKEPRKPSICIRCQRWQSNSPHLCGAKSTWRVTRVLPMPIRNSPSWKLFITMIWSLSWQELGSCDLKTNIIVHFKINRARENLSCATIKNKLIFYWNKKFDN